MEQKAIRSCLDGHEKEFVDKIGVTSKAQAKEYIEAARKAPDFKASLPRDVRFMKNLKKGKLGS